MDIVSTEFGQTQDLGELSIQLNLVPHHIDAQTFVEQICDLESASQHQSYLADQGKINALRSFWEEYIEESEVCYLRYVKIGNEFK